jgi:hypothetical protein
MGYISIQKFECPITIFRQVSKSQNRFLQYLFTTCPKLQVSRLYPETLIGWESQNEICKIQHFPVL